jgi:hypothetical protein
MRVASTIARGSAVALVASLAIGVAPAAGATEVRLFKPFDDPRFGDPGSVEIDADRSRNSIRVGFDRRREAYVIRDREPVKAQQCARLSRTAVRCGVDYPQVFVSAGGGDDRVKIRARVRASTELLGENGDDVLIGGRRADDVEGGDGDDDVRGELGDDSVDGDGLFGGVGDDVIRGGGGDDHLGGGPDEPGHDIFLGGGGDDFCSAKDGRRDVRIDCGRGRDDAVSGDSFDPRPRRCEDVRRRPI